MVTAAWRVTFSLPLPAAEMTKGGAVKNVEMTPLPLHLTVISTAAGQPTIGKPLIGQAREALIKSLSAFIRIFMHCFVMGLLK